MQKGGVECEKGELSAKGGRVEYRRGGRLSVEGGSLVQKCRREELSAERGS